jgi:adenylate kinase family enzyme
MTNPHGIIVFGLNGSGKTTLGRELAHILNFKHMDHEAYAFAESEIPYASERARDGQLKLMLADIENSSGFVLSAVMGDFGAEIEHLYNLAVFLSAPKEIRMKRLKRREFERHGDRILKGCDMYGQHQEFMEFAASRPLAKVVQWAKTLVCLVVRIDGTEDWRVCAAKIAKLFNESWRQ